MRSGKRRIGFLVLMGSFLSVLHPSVGACQGLPFAASHAPPQILDVVMSTMANLPKVEQLKTYTTAEEYNRAKLYLSGSEQLVDQLLGRQHRSYVRFGVALRRASVSKGAALVADRELGTLKQLTRSAGAGWIHSIISTLQRSSMCLNSVWVDALFPLLELPEGREIVQDYAVRAIQRWSSGGGFSWACQNLRVSPIHRQRFAIDLFYLYLYTIPDPIEAMGLYQNINERLTIKQSQITLGRAMTLFYSSPAASLKLSDFPQEEYSEAGDPGKLRALSDAVSLKGRGGR